MRVVYQRVSRANVSVNGQVVAEIGPGACLLVGFTPGDTDTEVDWLADKVAGLRVFPDEDDRMNRSLADVGGGVLVVSQFTLYGDATRGRRPSFVKAARPEEAIQLYQGFVAALRARGLQVVTGEFGAMMAVSLVNDGPVTLLLERDATPA